MTSVPLSDAKGGYLVTLDVYHTLHCVNRARKALYPAYYASPNRPEVDRAHVEHCLDLLRQVLMCHGDVALHTYQWLDDRPAPWPTFQTTHQCRKWERIVEWSRGRDTGVSAGADLAASDAGDIVHRRGAASIVIVVGVAVVVSVVGTTYTPTLDMAFSLNYFSKV